MLRTLYLVLAVSRSLELLQLYFASPVVPVNDPFGSSTCLVWLCSPTVPNSFKREQAGKDLFFLASAQCASVGGGKGGRPSVPEEGLRRGRGQQTSGLPQRQGDCQVMVLQAGRGQKELLDQKSKERPYQQTHSKGRDVRKPPLPSCFEFSGIENVSCSSFCPNKTRGL